MGKKKVLREALGALVALASWMCLAPPAFADEGMWPFDEIPAARVQATLGVSIDGAWLNHLRDASVRLTTGCSASIVSQGGLVLTNHHCIADCAQHLSTPGHDYVREGFLTDSRAEERSCAGLQAEVLESITDVTDAIFASSQGKVGQDYVLAREGALAAAEKAACGGDPHLRCQVISFYEGGEFKVYKYRKYSDVRLVFAPEFQAAFFGGDPDNFNFPRYDLDCAFLRLYEDGKPARTPTFLAWSTNAPTAGEPVFVSGNPAATERQLTVAQMQTLRDVMLPLQAVQHAELRGRLIEFGEQSLENQRIATDPLFAQENVYKVFRGREAALHDEAFMAARRQGEAELKAKLAADPVLAAQTGDPWSEIEEAQKTYAREYPVWYELESGAGGGSVLYRYARDLVRGAVERAKPSAQRLPEFSDSHLPLTEKILLDARPVETPLEELYLEFWLTKAREALGPDSPAIAMLLDRDSPEDLAQRLTSGTKLADPAVRRALWKGGLAAVQASDDPMIQFVLKTDPVGRAARQVWEDDVVGPVNGAAERIAHARYVLYGANLYPDANFSLRLSYGKVAGWSFEGQETAPFTTYAGLYGRATGKPPFQLPPRWAAAAGRLDPTTVLDFSTTNDITGGNSGSPVVDARGQIVGCAFDGNIHSIAGDFTYDPELNRTVAVSTGAITEALQKVYGRAALVRELTGE